MCSNLSFLAFKYCFMIITLCIPCRLKKLFEEALQTFYLPSPLSQSRMMKTKFLSLLEIAMRLKGTYAYLKFLCIMPLVTIKTSFIGGRNIPPIFLICQKWRGNFWPLQPLQLVQSDCFPALGRCTTTKRRAPTKRLWKISL